MKILSLRRSTVHALTVAVAASALVVAPAVAASAQIAPAFATAAQAADPLAPVVRHTGTAPTGYEVTFRFRAPDATSVKIRGEWGLRSVADPTTRPPSQFRPGDFFNEALVSEMTLDPATGVWSWTTPLPPGTWSYQFQATPSQAPGGLAYQQDPANPTFNQDGNSFTGSYEPLSQVYVPQDPTFGTDDRSLEAPALVAEQGELTTIRYSSADATTCATIILCTSPEGQHDLAVYTPAGYDPDRETPYPTLYLSHGGGGNEIDWFTQGAAANILDNLIAEGTMQPTVVVSTDFNGLPTIDGVQEEGYAQHLLNYVVPLVEGSYNVSDEVNDRAFGGLSAGGGRGGRLLFEHPDTFAYYGIWSSTSAFGPTIDMSEPTARDRLALHVGIGIQDPGTPRHEGLARLATTDIPFTRDDVNGVHSWDVWRQLMAIFAADYAFAHTSTELTSTGRAFTATVTPSTSTGPAPTGSVQFSLDGEPIGKAVTLKNGAAKVAIPASLGNGTVTAEYSGDDLYTQSNGDGEATRGNK